MQRKVIFTDASGNVVRTTVILPTIKGWVPNFVQFRGKLYKNKGGSLTTYFYHEETSFVAVESDKEYERLEFLQLDENTNSVIVP